MKTFIYHIIIILSLLFVNQTESYALFTKMHTPDYYEENARECFRKDKWAEGKKFLDEGWSEFGTMSVMNELMGRYYYHFKKYDKARYYLVRALRDDHSNTLAREILVNVEDETKNYSSAICYINELLEDNPYSRQWWRRKINIYRKQGNNIEADRLLGRLQQIYPNDDVVKKDVAYVHEQRLAKQKRDNNVVGQIESLETLIKVYPDNIVYYQQLAGALTQTGRTTEAIEILGRGAQLTGSAVLIQKKAAMLAEQGKYTEALNYLKECMRKNPSSVLSKTYDEIELSAAENAQMNDPYTSMAKVYSRQHNNEALNYLLNTSIARGYYEDALQYIKEAKQRRGETEDLLYKEFVVNRRLGNKSKALGCLTKIYAMNPRNSEVNEYLCEMRYSEASDEMGYGQYTEAIHLLEFVQEHAQDEELKKSAMMRLFNCFFETKRYDQAHQQLEKIKNTFDYENYAYQKAALYHEEGRTDKSLRFLASESEQTMDPLKSLLLAYQYEEYATPYIKDMIDRGMIKQADKWAKEATLVCPTSCDLLHMAITTADILGNNDDYEDMVLAGRARYPGDPFFIVKEANVLTRQGDYAGAVNLLRPELDTFSGDATLVGAFAEASQHLAYDQAKARAYSSAIATLDTALVYHVGDRELLIAKGEIYERMGQYDSAYVYQRYYRPGLMDYRQHSRHMEELKNNTFANEMTIGFRGGYQSLATLSYNRRTKKNNYTFNAAYSSAKKLGDNAALAMGEDWNGTPVTSGKGGALVGFDWSHTITTGRGGSYGASAAWGSSVFPQAMARLYYEMVMKHHVSLDIHAAYRHLKGQGMKNNASAGITLKKEMEMFTLSAGADAVTYPSLTTGKTTAGIEGNIAARFYPTENSRNSIFANISVGNVWQQRLLDTGVYGDNGKLSVGLNIGAHWLLTRFIAATLDASWYNQSVCQEYKNMFLVQGKLHFAF
ncbi:MAG: tetratricopeptide repeat protein [Prevotella sp.]|nr:tetratricopeptide repeat protein [Candidatus Prevotella equi]